MKLIPVDEIEHIHCEGVPDPPAAEFMEHVGAAIDLMRKHDGLGLAAPQVGIFERWFVAKMKDGVWTCINPAYYPIASGKQRTVVESCLSLPGRRYEVSRFKHIMATYAVLIEGSLSYTRRALTETDAVIFQHECDHLKGVTIRMKGKLYS